MAQKKRMATTRRTAFAKTDKMVYPARSKKNHTAVDPDTARIATFLRLQRSTSATARMKQIEQSENINIENKQQLGWVRTRADRRWQTCAATEGTVHGSRDLCGRRRGTVGRKRIAARVTADIWHSRHRYLGFWFRFGKTIIGLEQRRRNRNTHLSLSLVRRYHALRIESLTHLTAQTKFDK